MLQAGFTVVCKNGDRWCANHLFVTRENEPGPNGTVLGSYSALSFVSSGGLLTVRARDVERIEWDATGREYCSECDGSIANVVGRDEHRSPSNPVLGD